MAVLREFRIIILLTVFSTFVDCQITSSPSLEDVCVGDDVELDWVYGNDANFLSVTWTYINSQTSVQTTIMQQARGGTASVVNNYNVVHKTNGAITLTDVTKANSGSYKISVTYLSASAVDDTVTVTVKDCTGCPEDYDIRVIFSIVFGILGILALAGVIIGIVTNCFNNPVCLTVDVLGFVFDIISLGLSASVVADDKDCEDWIHNSAVAFVVIPPIVAVTAIVLTILVCLGVIGQGGNDGNIGNNGDHHGHGTNSSTVHSEREDTHRGTLSDRANSDGEVSRKDVHVQENRDNFSGRPMPPIPLTDKKGRGLSANYDDDHPMINVGIPERRAGDLGPLAEEPKKKKKKKNKAVNDDDV